MIQIKVGREWKNAPNAVEIGKSGIARLNLGIYGIVFYRPGEWRYGPDKRQSEPVSTARKSDKRFTQKGVPAVGKLAGKKA